MGLGIKAMEMMTGDSAWFPSSGASLTSCSTFYPHLGVSGGVESCQTVMWNDYGWTSLFRRRDVMDV